MRRFLLLSLLLTLTLSPFQAARAGEDDFLLFLQASIFHFPNKVHVINDIQYYDEEPAHKHKLDIYYCSQLKNQKVIVFVPGGAWRQGDKATYNELGKTLCGYYGYTVVAVNYELTNEDDGQAVHPDHVQDVARAFAWVKQNISPYGRADKLYLFGQSAGAHLVSLLALDTRYLEDEGCSQDDIAAVIAFSGSYDLYDLVVFPDNPLELDLETTTMFRVLMTQTFGSASATVLNAASPERHISLDQPPFLVVDVDQDLAGFNQEADNFMAAIRALIPAPPVESAHLIREDFSDNTWLAATAMAAAEPVFAEYVGHYAEMVAINRREYESRSTRLVVDFIEAH